MYSITRTDRDASADILIDVYETRETARLALSLLLNAVCDMPLLTVGKVEADQFHVFLKGRENCTAKSFIRIETF